MPKFVLPLLLSAILMLPSGAAAQATPSAQEIHRTTQVILAMFLAADRKHLQAASIFAELAEQLNSPSLMREAYREALGGARDNRHALQYARRWRALGGGTPSLQAQAHLYLAARQWANAGSILSELKAAGQSDKDLAKLLEHAGGQRGQLGRQYYSDTADGDMFLAWTSADGNDWGTYQHALNRLKNRPGRQTEFTFLTMHLKSLLNQHGAGSKESALSVADDYLARNCPDFPGDCTETNVLHAYQTFVQEHGGDWQKPGTTDEAQLTAGRFLEASNAKERAKVHYEKSQKFHAKLGLARILRDQNNNQGALDILNNTPVANDYEFSRREVTAANIIQEQQSNDAALLRVTKARRTLPQNEDLAYFNAFLLEELGDIDGALKLLHDLTRWFPRSADNWNALGYLLAVHNRELKDAEKYIHRALALDPNNPGILDSLGWVYFRQSRLQEALQLLTQATRRSQEIVIILHLAEVYWVLGEHAAAKKLFMDVKARDPGHKELNDTLRRLDIDLL